MNPSPGSAPRQPVIVDSSYAVARNCLAGSVAVFLAVRLFPAPAATAPASAWVSALRDSRYPGSPFHRPRFSQQD